MLHIRIIHPDNLVYEGEAEYLIAPGVKNALGIMPGHTPMFAELRKGEIILHGSEEKTFPIEAGMLKVRDDQITILVGLE